MPEHEKAGRLAMSGVFLPALQRGEKQPSADAAQRALTSLREMGRDTREDA